MKHLESSTIAETVREGMSLILFSMEGCGPCKLMIPAFMELDRIYGDKITFGIMKEYSQTIQTQYRVMGFPTILLFANGVEVERWDGRQTYAEFDNLLKRLLYKE